MKRYLFSVPLIYMMCVIVFKTESYNHPIDGYFAFQKASQIHKKPSKVRKPPYIVTEVECAGIHLPFNHFSTKYTLCGDLNLGFIPKNPIQSLMNGEPYPFELIKNKSLQFLANSIPVLKQQINSIPKVARFYKASDLFEQQIHKKRFTRDVKTNTNSSILERNKLNKLPRESLCDGDFMVVCKVIESIKDDGLLTKSFLNTLMSAVGNAATIGNIASLVNQFGSALNEPPQQNNNSNKSTISQVLSALSTMSGSNGYNPLVSIIDYISTYQKSPKTNKTPLKRRKPDSEDLLTDSQEVPSTPCPSVDEYVSPVYARNYQGVWKYVVQVPNEGYFTQTIQRTSCLKTRCQFLDGICSESPRWVSLLVAEVFYPNLYFPMSHLIPMNYNNLMQLNNKPIVTQDAHALNIDVHENPQFQYNFNSRMDLYKEQKEIRDKKVSPRNQKKMENDNKNNKNNKTYNETLKMKNIECDGYDNVGCYVIRVYYDWFLVNGSCKCWKSPNTSQTSNINEAIKRIFIGKW